VEQPASGPGGLWTQFDATLERRLIRPIFKKPNRITAPRRASEGECPNHCPIPPCWLWHSKSSRFMHGHQIRLDPRSEGFLRITVDQVPFLAMTSPNYSFLCRFFLTQGRIQSPALIPEKVVHKSIDLIVNQERHVMTASQECFVV
jgi:hypothetical protein